MPFDREHALMTISDRTKEATGCRVREDWASMSDEELEKAYHYWAEAALDAAASEERQAARAQEEWIGHMQKLIDLGAKTAPTAIRWDMKCLGCDPRDIGYYVYQTGMDYSMERIIEGILALEKEPA